MGIAARGADLQTTIRRGVPALRETDRVLDILAANRQTLRRLTRRRRPRARGPGRQPRGRRALRRRGRRHDGRLRRAPDRARRERAQAARRSCASCARPCATSAPPPTKQTPALADLRAAAPQLTTLLRRLGPFAEAARPAVRGLGEASTTGSAAVRDAASTVSKLRGLGSVSTEPMRNLRFVLEDVNDRDRAVEPNRLSPGNGAGFTGLEALLQYFFTQSQSMNIYDSKSYILKIGVLLNECSQYTNAKTAREHPERTANCKQWLGPNQLNVTGGAVARTEDGSSSAGPSDPARERGRRRSRRPPTPPRPARARRRRHRRRPPRRCRAPAACSRTCSPA